MPVSLEIYQQRDNAHGHVPLTFTHAVGLDGCAACCRTCKPKPTFGGSVMGQRDTPPSWGCLWLDLRVAPPGVA